MSPPGCILPHLLPRSLRPDMKSQDCPQHQGGTAELCQHLLSSLSDTIPSVQCLKGQWSSVSALLPLLRSAVSSLSALPAHPLSSELLLSLSSTISLSLTISLHCSSPQPPAGKLHTQSELSSASSSLHRHLSDAQILLTSGVLLPTSVPSTRREALRSEFRSLITRLQIGPAASKAAPLDSLVNLLSDDDKTVIIAVAQGIVPAIVKLIESSSSSPEIKEKAVTALARVSAIDSCRGVLDGEGLLMLTHVARIVESGSALAKEKACVILQVLTLPKENATAMGSRGSVDSLLEICEDGTPAAQAAAAAVLRNLAAIDEIRGNLLVERAVPILTRLVASGTIAAQENAVACIRNLAAGECREMKLRILTEFRVESLMNYWDAQRGDLEPAVGLLRNVAAEYSVAELLVDCGFVPRIVSALKCESSGTRVEAARAIPILAHVGKARREISETGCVPKLVRLLEAKAAEERSAAVQALAELVMVAENRRAFKRDDKGIANVVQLLNPRTRDVDKRWPVAVLAAVVESRKCRRKMMEVGATNMVGMLVEMEVSGAKRLLDALVKGSLWGGLFGKA